MNRNELYELRSRAPVVPELTRELLFSEDPESVRPITGADNPPGAETE